MVRIYYLGAEYRRDDVLRVESSWHGDYESDSESLDNDVDDPLRSGITPGAGCSKGVNVANHRLTCYPPDKI
jgi:hypothetical protein